MRSNFGYFVFFLIVFIILVDLYTFKGLRLLIQQINNYTFRLLINYFFWTITVLFILSIFYFFRRFPQEKNPKLFNQYFTLFGLFLLIYLPKLVFVVFHFSDDVLHVIRLLIQKINQLGPQSIAVPISKISRWKYLSQVGTLVATILFLFILYGILIGRFNYRVEREKIYFKEFPKALNGLKIVQISDIHIGSFYNHRKQLEKAINIVNRLEPDLLLFTGDLVNNFYEELDGWIPVLSKLNAQYGKFSVLGNHDYGDYYEWPSPEEKRLNLDKVIKAHQEIGFHILMNSSNHLSINGEEIVVIGVENWGLPPFKQYGNLQKAYDGLENHTFKIFLTHDPSHWDAEVVDKKDIHLTLSGHTHSMQFGIRLGNFKWSLIKYRYPRWAGLYQENDQYLYVNSGLGYIGFPGRVGMLPEITLIELYHKN